MKKIEQLLEELIHVIRLHFSLNYYVKIKFRNISIEARFNDTSSRGAGILEILQMMNIIYETVRLNSNNYLLRINSHSNMHLKQKDLDNLLFEIHYHCGAYTVVFQ